MIQRALPSDDVMYDAVVRRDRSYDGIFFTAVRTIGLDPTRVRRWFKQNHDMTFHAYHRARRVGGALRTLRDGGSVTGAAMDHGYESLSAFYDAFKDLLGDSPARSRRAGAEPIH